MPTNAEIVAELTATFVASIRTYGVVKSLEAFSDALATLADPTGDEKSEEMKAYIAASQMEEVTGSWE